MDIQRLRNLTTGRLHTEVSHVYLDIEFFVGSKGLMTHQIPRALAALRPHLLANFPDARLWDDAYDPSHVGEIAAAPMTPGQQAEYWGRFQSLPLGF